MVVGQRPWKPSELRCIDVCTAGSSAGSGRGSGGPDRRVLRGAPWPIPRANGGRAATQHHDAVSATPWPRGLHRPSRASLPHIALSNPRGLGSSCHSPGLFKLSPHQPMQFFPCYHLPLPLIIPLARLVAVVFSLPPPQVHTTRVPQRSSPRRQ